MIWKLWEGVKDLTPKLARSGNESYLDGDEGAGPLEDLLELLLRLVGAQGVPRLGHHVLADGADVVVVLFKIIDINSRTGYTTYEYNWCSYTSEIGVR